MKKTLYFTAAFLIVFSASAIILFSQTEKKDDREQVIEHLHDIFKAFVNEDKKVLIATHSDDWTGFFFNSREIVSGIDGYMKGKFENSKMLDYEIEDVRVKTYGDVAVVYYVAHWRSRLKASGQVIKVRARSMDIYRKDKGRWVQEGSNLNFLPTAGAFTTPGVEKYYDVGLESDIK